MVNRVTTLPGECPVRNVLVSVSDKTGLPELIPVLAGFPQVTFYSTGGTFETLKSLLGSEGKDRLIPVSRYTGQPEMQGGLVKTLDYKIYLGLLSEPGNPAHREDQARTGAVELDMVVVNLYPFAKTIASPGADPEAARGQIDIGGPCLLRAAAKNFLRVAAVCDPADYSRIAGELARRRGALGVETRFYLAGKVFALTAAYDAAIAAYLGGLDFAALSACYPSGGEGGRG
ncbi:MAG: hypothetical protein LBQ61_03005 [Spirochaetales bacterium]|jgi:phosphoribosylaminoimidazolecarboxamide formyltransferase/IMP cyclohydrolase|nr:hypothetical protein [Spirochaetales bacterium]